MKSLYFVEH